jgi:pyruvate dehydrogenase E2 component (dihydrolipoamide acetyltransferase)
VTLHAAAAPARARTTPPTPVPVAEGEEYVDRALSPMRKTIARRLVEAKQTIPHFYLTSECDAGPLVAFRAALNELVPEEAKISFNDLVVKAAAVTLRRVPQVNASFQGDRIRTFGRVHVGVAVALDDGLVTPVIFDADLKGVAAISAEVRELAARARTKRLSPEEMTGSTFSVSNLGMYGIDHFEAVINPPEGAILAVGAIRKQPVVLDGDRLGVGLRLGLTLSCDHRVIDGAVGAHFLAELVRIIERPSALAL